MQAGLSGDGLPIGIELLGKRFSDERLVGLAYSLEQSAGRRRAPTTTPPLVHGVAPTASSSHVTTRAGSLTATTRMTVDPVRNELRWMASVRGPVAELAALVLRRTGAAMAVGASINGKPAAHIALPDSQVRVVARLLGPGMARGGGTIPLSYADRVAFATGRMSVMLLPVAGAAGEHSFSMRRP